MNIINSQPSLKCKKRRSKKRLSEQDVSAYVLWYIISPLFPKDQPIHYDIIIDTLNDAKSTNIVIKTEVQRLLWLYLKNNSNSEYDSIFDIFVKYKLVEETVKRTSFSSIDIIFKTPSAIIQSRIEKAVLIYKVKKL